MRQAENCREVSSPWILKRSHIVDEAEFRAFLGNGYLGMRVDSRPVSSGRAECSTYLSRLKYGKDTVDSIKGSTSNLKKPVELADTTGVLLKNDLTGEDLFNGKSCQTFEELLDLEKAELRKRVDMSTCSIKERLLLSRCRKNLIVQRFSVVSKSSLVLAIEVFYDESTSAGVGTIEIGIEHDSDVLFLKQATIGTDISVGYATKLVFPCWNSPEKLMPIGVGRLGYIVLVEPDVEVEFFKISAIFDSSEEGDPLQAACREIKAYTWDDVITAVRAHYDSWGDLWSRRVELQNEHYNQRSLVMQYNLLSSHREDNVNSIPALGLSGTAWNAFVFPWDAMLWMFPYYLVVHTDWARAMLDYEVQEGPHYGFQSRLDYYRSGKANKMYEAGCVAFAAWQYYLVTKALQWLTDSGWHIIKAAAEGYARRSVYNRELDRYEIKDIWPVDEWGTNSSSNDVFTNGLGNLVIQIAYNAAELTANKVSSEMEHILGKIKQKGFWLPFDSLGHRYIEYGEYVDQRIVNCYNGEVIKQADTNLLTYPLELISDNRLICNNFDYYRTRVDEQGPEMTWGIYATIAAQLRREEDVLESLQRIEPYLKTEFLLFSETSRNNNTVFHTGSGDYMQAIIFGLGGLRIHWNEIYFKPLISKRISGNLRLRSVHINGEIYEAFLHCGNNSIKLKGKSTKRFLYSSGTSSRVINRFHQDGLRDLEGYVDDTGVFRAIETGLIMKSIYGLVDLCLSDLSSCTDGNGHVLEKAGASCVISCEENYTILSVKLYSSSNEEIELVSQSWGLVDGKVILPEGECVAHICLE